MKLGKLYESYTTNNSIFLNLYQQELLTECNTLNETKSTIKKVLNEADKYAENNKLKYKYFQLAKEPLWVDVIVESQHFIYQGFDAYISVDLNNVIDDITPYVVVQNSNVSSMNDGQTIAITEAFITGLNDLQREIFLESLEKVENETVNKLKAVWSIEKERIDKWVKTTEINLKRD